jgi:hypothetical protein
MVIFIYYNELERAEKEASWLNWGKTPSSAWPDRGKPQQSFKKKQQMLQPGFKVSASQMHAYII